MVRLTVIGLGLVACFCESGTATAQMITAHRGASHDAPENTLAAFQLAWEQGADAIEADFFLTVDGKIICSHDADTKRITGVKKVIAETTLDELRKLDAGRWKGKQFAGEKLPTFEEVLALVPAGKRFFVELKTGPEIVPVLAEELERLPHDPASLLIIAFKPETIAACKEAFPDIEAHWLTSFKDNNGSRQPTAAEIAETVRRTGADGVGMKGVREVVDEAFVAELKSRGVGDFHVWTIDSIDDAQYFQKLGASGITTNRPAYIRNGLESREGLSATAPPDSVPALAGG